MALPPDELFRRGLGLLQAGNVAEAERLFKDILRGEPRHAGALNLLAIVTMQTGRLAEAEDYAKRALKESPQSDATHYNYGLILKALGRPAEAVQRLSQALALNANVPESWNNRGVTFNELKRYRDALADFDRALALKTNYPDAHCNKGRALAGLRLYDQALAAYDKALALSPSLVEAWIGRGNVCAKLKRHDDALAAYGKATEIRGDVADAWLGRGNVHTKLGRCSDALAAYDKALLLRPDLAEAWLGRGNVHTELKQHNEALAAYNNALALKADLAEAQLARGNLFYSLNRYDDARAAYDEALALNPELAGALVGRGNILCDSTRYEDAAAAFNRALALEPDLAEAWVGRGNVDVRLKRYAEAVAAYSEGLAINPDLKYVEGDRLHAKQYACDWEGLAADASHLLAAIRAGKPASVPFSLLAIDSTPADQRRCAELLAGDKYPALPAVWRGDRYKHDRIRVAYLSGDFRDHPVAFLIAGLLECHDRSRFATTAISWTPDDNSAMRKRIGQSVERFVDVCARSDAEVAKLMRELEIDIAVDLMGFTNGLRTGILARRPAPVQVNYLGFAGTLGAGYCDYILADRTVIPGDDFQFYCENVVWLPGSYMPTDSRRQTPARIPTRGECGLPDNGFVFCCFNAAYKLHPETFAVWMRLLKTVEGGVLWLSDPGEAAKANLRRAAERCGVPADRLIFAARVDSLADHLARQSQADLFLDTLPYTAHATAVDALWAGVPLLTCRGATFAGRVGASLLNAVGLSELVTENLADYEALAGKLAREPALLASLKAKLASQRDTCALFDTPRFTRHIEAAYTTMWERYQRGEPPAPINVAG